VGVVAFTASVLVATGAQIGGIVLLVLLGEDGGIASLVVGCLGLALLVMPPLVLGAVLAAWDASPTDDGKRRHRRFLWSLIGLQVVGAVLVVASGASAGSPVWLAASFVGVGALLTVAALVAGPALGERARRRADELGGTVAWSGVAPVEVRRAVRTVTLTFVVTFVPVAVGLSFVPTDDDDPGFLLVTAGLAFIAASVACVVISLRMQRQIVALLGRDQDRARRIGRAVLSRRAVDLSPDDERLSARWASITAVTLPVQLAQTELLFAGIVSQQLVQALGDDGALVTFARVLIASMAVAMIAFVPLFVVRIRRSRRWADARAHLLAPSGPRRAAAPRPPGGERS
jgi:MFS family permease